MWACGRLLLLRSSLVNITFRVAARCSSPAITQTSLLRVSHLMESIPLPSAPQMGREDIGGTGEADVSAQWEQKALEDGKPDEAQKNKKSKCKRKRVRSIKSVRNLLPELPFANEDINAVFEIARTADKKVKKKRKRHQLENEDDDKSKKQKRANYFVSLPITNPKLHDDIQTIQDSVLQKENRLSRAMIPKGSYHITLFVMHLASEEDVTLAVSALLESKTTVEEILRGLPLILTFCGLSDFKNEVVFAQTTQGDAVTQLKQITETIGKIFEKKDIAVSGSKDFVPHLTLMKLSRAPKLRKQGIKKIDASMYKDFQSHYFGEECLQRLDLCSMLKKRQTNGYYHTEASIFFGHKNGREPDDAELVSLSKRLVENAVLKAVQQYIEETQQAKTKQTDGISLKPGINNERIENNIK
ncbi:PREDICTED: A-kinase anchor protein 7-like [Nanorana parkeri]|uniref:A-kinase anchor protein 7-like n=1 Tax=Nanorana parkeri TaxID=125878 RepID=UPI000854FF9F|nr:PREDICTED: A-kinase anchor protein 7-like [Nanorana parkeri]